MFKSTGDLIFEHVAPNDEIDRFTYPEKVAFDQQGTPYLLYQLGTDTVSNSIVTLDFANKTLREVFKPEEEGVSLQQLFIAKDGTLNAVGWQYLGYASPTDSFLYSVSTNGSAQTTHIGTPYSLLHKGPDDTLFLTTERMDADGLTVTEGLRAFDAVTAHFPCRGNGAVLSFSLSEKFLRDCRMLNVFTRQSNKEKKKQEDFTGRSPSSSCLKTYSEW